MVPLGSTFTTLPKVPAVLGARIRTVMVALALVGIDPPVHVTHGAAWAQEKPPSPLAELTVTPGGRYCWTTTPVAGALRYSVSPVMGSTPATSPTLRTVAM